MSIIDTDGARARRIQLAHLRQELLSPVSAMLGYAEILHEEVTGQGRADILPDMNRILGAARNLASMVDRLVDSDHNDGVPGPATATQEQDLRHELRTPLNAIKGYSEMLREDVAHVPSGSLRADLDRLLAAANDLLLRVDRIVQFSVDVGETSLASDQTGPKASVHIQGVPTGAALASKIRPTTTPSAITSKSSAFHSPDGRLAEARLRMR
jgi:adenylate cyclase